MKAARIWRVGGSCPRTDAGVRLLRTRSLSSSAWKVARSTTTGISALSAAPVATFFDSSLMIASIHGVIRYRPTTSAHSPIVATRPSPPRHPARPLAGTTSLGAAWCLAEESRRIKPIDLPHPYVPAAPLSLAADTWTVV
jgi:hypothetical protein